jgi:hypothetical protein
MAVMMRSRIDASLPPPGAARSMLASASIRSARLDDAHELAAPHHGQALDILGFHHSDDLIERSIFRHG